MASESSQQKSVFDADRQHLGDVYAKALWGLAEKLGQTDALVDELDSFVDVLNQLPRLRAALESPQVSIADKQRVVEKAIARQASPALLNFVRVVIDKGRADCLNAIRNSARALRDEQAGRVQATMITAQPVEPAVRQQVASRLGDVLGKQVSLEAQVDAGIIGGLVVRVGDTVYDGSLRNQLEQVRTAAIGRANQEIRNSLDRFATAVESGTVNA